MTEAQKAVDSAIEQASRLRKLLKRSSAKQVWSDDERQTIKAAAYAWFNNNRKAVALVLDGNALQDLDEQYRYLIAASGRATVRSRYLNSLKRVRGFLSQLQTDQAVSLSTAPAVVPQATTDVPPSFAPLVADAEMQAVLAKRWQECITCVEAKVPLAATVMMGGLLEGLLLAKINQLNDKAPVFKATSAPKDKTGKPFKLSEWGLKNYIDVAHELGWITQTTKDVGTVLRDYRNFIHPQKELSHGISISPEDAKTLWEVAKSMMRQILKP